MQQIARETFDFQPTPRWAQRLARWMRRAQLGDFILYHTSVRRWEIDYYPTSIGFDFKGWRLRYWWPELGRTRTALRRDVRRWPWWIEFPATLGAGFLVTLAIGLIGLARS